jgi:hypothetical protein
VPADRSTAAGRFLRAARVDSGVSYFLRHGSERDSWSVGGKQAAESAGTAPWPRRSMGASSPPGGPGSTAEGSAAGGASRYHDSIPSTTSTWIVGSENLRSLFS